ncbi:MAG: hypothetical protein FWD92_03975 [Methanomassiliicoccaceae archaeon]|nr:hypothetical protein [Methanomassiliicoccaceae archaeon]
MDDLNKKINVIVWLVALGIVISISIGIRVLASANDDLGPLVWVAVAVMIITLIIAAYLTYGKKSKGGYFGRDVLYFKNCPKCRYDTISDTDNIRICTNCGDDLTYIKPLKKMMP